MDPVAAIRLATWNPAQHFRLHQRGAVTPGRRADLVVFDDLQAPRARLVLRNGELMARDGRMAVPPRPPSRTLRSTMNVAWEGVDFRIPAGGGRARTIGVRPDSLVTAALVDEPPIRDGEALADPSRDLLKIAVIERHMASGAVGKGFVRGMGLREGALASSVAHDHHNLIVVGAGGKRFRPLPKFPAIDRDLSMVVDEAGDVEKLTEAIWALQQPFVDEVTVFDVYQGAPIPKGKKGISYRIRFQAGDRTLTDEEVNRYHQKIIFQLMEIFKAELRQ